MNLSFESTHRIPLRALLLSVTALAIPVVSVIIGPEWSGENPSVLLWLTALLPAFLLTYYRGWRGASLGLAIGMVVLSTTHAILVIGDFGTPDWPMLLGIVIAYIGICFGIGWLAELLHRQLRMAENMALTDMLTGLPNRRHLSVFIDAAFAAAVRDAPLTVVLFDLDHFKKYNDRYGHSAGDEVIRQFGEVLGGISRRSNLVARYGGEEFIAVLSECDTNGALVFTERVRKKLQSIAVRGAPVTVSAGIASYEKGMGSPELLVAEADRALYAAKDAGRDCVWAVRKGRLFAPSLPGTTAPSPARKAMPERAGRAEEIPRASDPPAPSSRARPGERVLLVDDDSGSRGSIARLLRRLGYDVVEEAGGPAAIARLEANADRFDLLVADLVMPGMSGFTLAQKVVPLRPRLRVLYMSGFIQEDVAWPEAPGHVTAFLGKPMTVGELARKVREILDAPDPEERVGTLTVSADPVPA